MLFSGKAKGYKTTLLEFLKENSNQISAEFNSLSNSEKDIFLTGYL